MCGREEWAIVCGGRSGQLCVGGRSEQLCGGEGRVSNCVKGRSEQLGGGGGGSERPLPTTSNPHYPHHTSSTPSLLHILTFHAITPPPLTLIPHPNFTFSLFYTLTPPPSRPTPHSRLACLKYLVLANMLMKSGINPFDSQEVRVYRHVLGCSVSGVS